MQGLANAPTIGSITQPAAPCTTTAAPSQRQAGFAPSFGRLTRFSLNAPHWVPQVLRYAPLKLSSLVLRQYYRLVR